MAFSSSLNKLFKIIFKIPIYVQVKGLYPYSKLSSAMIQGHLHYHTQESTRPPNLLNKTLQNRDHPPHSFMDITKGFYSHNIGHSDQFNTMTFNKHIAIQKITYTFGKFQKITYTFGKFLQIWPKHRWPPRGMNLYLRGLVDSSAQ